MMCQDDIFEFYGNVFDINIYEYDDKPKSGIIFSTTQQIFIKRGGMAEFNVCINHFNTKDDVLCKIQGKKIREQDIVRKDS
jgi:hypothetical protein